jgi:hypothetical protein
MEFLDRKTQAVASQPKKLTIRNKRGQFQVWEIPLLMNFPMERSASGTSNCTIIAPYSSAHSVMSVWKPSLISCARFTWAGRRDNEIRFRACQSLDRER